MNKIISKILNDPEIKEKPPVLVDIGASEKIHPKWKKIAIYSVCLAFDADERDFKFIEKEQSRFKKLYVYNSVASDKDINKTDFYLTKSPYCSSILQPDLMRLKPYVHSNLFEIEKKVKLNSIHIQKALDKANLKYVDWFKTDSQGIDLRLFNSLDEKIRRKIIVAEFEPGIIDAYLYEDKLYSVLQELSNREFWLTDLVIKGVPRFPNEFLVTEFKGKLFRKLIKESLKKSPGWGEMTFFNTFNSSELGKREYLLGWLFSTLQNHHSFAFVLAETGLKKFDLALFAELKRFSKKKIKSDVYSLKFLPSVYELIKKKL
ncbi:MAG: FkbM family methyltransferase [bacterium]|nr:FkbM family methyltransferase [bacterium]